MSDLNQEPISRSERNGNDYEASELFKRLQTVESLRPSDSRVYSADFIKAKEKLTEDSIDILAGASRLTPEEKIDFAIKFIPLVDWKHSWDTGLDKEKVAKEDISINRQTALKTFLMEIPVDVLDDSTINTLFEIEESNKSNLYRRLTGLRHFLVSSISQMPSDRGKQFMDRLNPYFGYDTNPQVNKYATQTGVGEQVFAMRGWTVEESLPYVNIMIDSDLKKEGQHLGAIAKAIESWPQVAQEDVIRRTLGKSGLEGLYTDGLFLIMKSWWPEQSKPLLGELLSAPWGEGSGQSISYWDRNYGSLAKAMSNWSQEELNSFLADEDNTRFLRDVANSYELNYRGDPKFKHSYEEEYDRILNTFRVAILRERDGDFSEEMIEWLKENIVLHRGEQTIPAARVILKNISSFSPELASSLVLSRSESEVRDTVDAISELPKDVQIEFLKPIADLYMEEELINYNEQFKFKHAGSRAYEKIVKEWNEDDVDKLVLELLSRGEISAKQFNPNANERRKASNIVNAFELLDKREVIKNPEIIRKILVYSFDEYDPDSELSDEYIMADILEGKIDHNANIEELIIEAARDAVSARFIDISEESLERVNRIISLHGSVLKLSDIKATLPKYVQSSIDLFEVADTNKLLEIVGQNIDYFSLLSKTFDMPPKLTKEDISTLPKIFMNLVDAEIAKRNGVDLSQIESDEDYKKIFDAVRGKYGDWKDELVICESFEDGAKLFGYERMFKYIRREGLSIHDALHVFKDVVYLQSVSGMEASQFYGQILDQVAKDDSGYETGTAHHELNSIASNFDSNFEELLTIAEKVPDNEQVSQVAEMLKDPNTIFASWDNLKLYANEVKTLYKIKELDSTLDEYPQNTDLGSLFELSQKPQIGHELLDSLKGLTELDFNKQIEPILAAQGDAAFLYFKSIKLITMNMDGELSGDDIDYIVLVGKKYGTKSRNILEKLLSKVDSISEERPLIESYVDDIGVIDYNLFKEYKHLKEVDDKEGLGMLKERINSLQDKIYAGEMSEADFGDSLYEAVSYYTFPPAIGLTQDQYEHLNRYRPDRRGDVPKELDDLQYTQMSLDTGRYVLGEDKELDLEDWNILGKVVKKINKEIDGNGRVKINESKIAEKLIEMYKAGGPKSKEDRQALYESMYRYHLNHDGGKLDEGYKTTLDGLMKYKEFIGERIKNNLIKDCLATYAVEHPEEMDVLKKDVQNKVKKYQERNIGVVKGMLKGVNRAEGETNRKKATDKLDDFLRDYGMSYEEIKDKKFVEYKKLLIMDEGIDLEELVYRKISSDLVSGINKTMRKEVDKFEFGSHGEATKQTVDLDFVVSKKKEHGVAGYTMGVCVTPDEELWNDPQFWNGIFFDSESKQSMGGIHFLVRDGCLTLPGINPSLDLLSTVNHEQLFDKIIEKAKEVKEKLGLKKLLIPQDSIIHSNRNQIQEIIRRRNYPEYKFDKEQSFSYHPYEYSFQEMLEVE